MIEPRLHAARLISVANVTRQLGLSETTIEKLAAAGKIGPVIQHGGQGSRRYLRVDGVQAYLDRIGAADMPASPREAA